MLLDLGVVPATLAAGVALLRGTPIAATALYAVMPWYALVPSSVAAMSIAMLANDDPNAAAGQVWLLCTISLLFVAITVWMYRPLLHGQRTNPLSVANLQKAPSPGQT